MKKMLTSSPDIICHSTLKTKDDYERNWKPIMGILSVFGLDMTIKKRNMYAILITILINLYFLILVCDSVSDLTREKNSDLKMSYVVPVAEVVIGMICFYHCNRHKNQIYQNMMKIYDISEIEKLKIWQRYSVLINILLSFLIAAGSIAFVFIQNFNLHYDNPVFVALNVSSDVKMMTKIGIKVVSEVLIFLPQSFITLLFVIICGEIKERFSRLNNKIESDNLSKNVLNLVIEKYVYLDDMVCYFEDTYAPIMFFWTVRIAIKIGVSVNFLLSHTNFLSLVDCLYISLWCGWSVYLYTEVCLFASRVTDSATDFLTLLYNKSQSFYNECMKESVFQFCTKCSLEPPMFTGWRMFEVDRGLLLTIASITLTYLIVMYQLQ